ncbi:hypothetical protein AB6D34_18420 [Pectobacterium brasiliense]|uniref:Uncharacterized protein n=1 Tax=Pectobacterium brasiliense TaxID=180957 RepID=A0A3S0XS68_9GAMM|nr:MULTISPECIES: hypothetical protein [Pectobacterium]GKW29449.1 hypothetical protein PEC331060_26270 [Pectobacterium carotovorum subsp. carotovorum]MBN3048080.1 hypothetical protein [Pectobacterium brasiliense]MBN3057055.1 hypothetical protein [Pectobacterium brasiliense]MBN3077633.1 hypothetical protein [Pectobacterium brasiliense]MBN3082012.1 hypothetical protein [Pectobacterium polaris]
MLKKAKVYKAIISVTALFSFIYWGLDPEIMCKVASETPQACSLSERSLIMNALGSGFAIMLTAMAAAILALWVSKD